jgi:regulator of nucleoside diphosphate kinase
MASSPQIIVASEDRDRLLPLVEQPATSVAQELEVELDRARVLPLSDVPPDVVVMDSEFEYEDTESGQRRRLRLVYPGDADAAAGRVSVLAPLGCAIIGLRVGQEIDWHMPGGDRHLRVVAVHRDGRSSLERV